MERPEDGAPRLAWHLYVFERVAPIVATKDQRFAEVVRAQIPLVQAAHAALSEPSAIPDHLLDAATQALAELIAFAQAVFDVVAYSGKGDTVLVQQIQGAFAPATLFSRGSRFWWHHGLEMPTEGGAYFAPEASRCEAVYQNECNRLRLGEGRIEEIIEEVRKGEDVTSIQRAAGIGLFQAGPDDSEDPFPSHDGQHPEEWVDAKAIMRGAGIGVFQSGVASTPTEAPKDKQP